MKQLIAATTALLVMAVCSAASAQTIVYEAYSPAVVVAQSPVIVQSPVVYETWRPVVRNYNYNPPVSSPNFTGYTSNYGNRGAITTYAPVTAYSPVVTEAYSPVVTETYSPVVTTTYSPVVTATPVVTYSPVTTYYSPVVVRPRYVAGQPVRNFFRAMGP